MSILFCSWDEKSSGSAVEVGIGREDNDELAELDDFPTESMFLCENNVEPYNSNSSGSITPSCSFWTELTAAEALDSDANAGEKESMSEEIPGSSNSSLSVVSMKLESTETFCRVVGAVDWGVGLGFAGAFFDRDSDFASTNQSEIGEKNARLKIADLLKSLKIVKAEIWLWL